MFVVLKLSNILVIFNQESKKKSLSLSNVAGAYFILISGLVVSIIVGVIEFIYSKAKPDQPLSEVSNVVPTKSESDEIFCLQLLSKTLSCTLHLS